MLMDAYYLKARQSIWSRSSRQKVEGQIADGQTQVKDIRVPQVACSQLRIWRQVSSSAFLGSRSLILGDFNGMIRLCHKGRTAELRNRPVSMVRRST